MSALKVRVLGALLALGLLVVLGRLGQLQLLEGEAYAREAAARIRRIEVIEAPRGRILDRRGRVHGAGCPAHRVCGHLFLSNGKVQPGQRFARVCACLADG